MSWSVSSEHIPYARGPLRARPLGNLAATLMGVAAILVLMGSLAFVRSPQDVAEIPPASAKLAEERPAPTAPVVETPARAAFDLDDPGLAGLQRLSVSSPTQSGGRQDTLARGAFDGGKLFLRLDMLQPAGDKIGSSDFFLDMAREAARTGLAVIRIGRPTQIAARAGAFEAADIRLAPRDGNPAGERSCLALRLVNSKLSMEIAGLGCSGAAETIDRRAMACLLDRLYYLPTGDDRALAKALPRPEDGASCLSAPAPARRAESAPAAPQKRAAARH